MQSVGNRMVGYTTRNCLTVCVAATVSLPELSATVLSCFRHNVVTAGLTADWSHSWTSAQRQFMRWTDTVCCYVRSSSPPCNLPLHSRASNWPVRTALFCAVTQRVGVIPYRRFGTTYSSYLSVFLKDGTDRFSPKHRWGMATTRCVTTQKSAVLICFAIDVCSVPFSQAHIGVNLPQTHFYFTQTVEWMRKANNTWNVKS